MLDITVEQKVPKTGINLAYFASKPLRPSDNVTVINTGLSNEDLSYLSVTEIIAVEPDISGYLPAMSSSDFIITDKVDDDGTPLFYEYETRYLMYETSDNPIDNLLIIDRKGSVVDNIGYSFEATPSGIDPSGTEPSSLKEAYNLKVYTSISNSDGVTRKLRYNRMDSDKLVRSATEIINMEDIYSEYINTDIPITDKQYELAYTTGGEIKIKPQKTASKWYIKILNPLSIYLRSPVNRGEDEDWNIRVRKGKVVKVYNGELYEFSVPDFDHQNFDEIIGSPVSRAIDEIAEYVDAHTIKVVQTPIYAALNRLKRPIGLAVYLNNKKLNVDEIKDWDIHNGLIELTPIVSPDDVVRVTYRFVRDYLEYTGFETQGIIYDLDLNPTKFHSPEIPNSTIYIYHEPNKNITKDEILSTDDAIRFTYDPIILQSSYRLVLGKIEVIPNSVVDEVQVIDTRARGGGLITSLSDNSAKDIQPQSQFYSDLGYLDGRLYQANGVLIVELPLSILDTLTEEDVQAKVNKYLATGEYAFIKYIGEPPLPTRLSLEVKAEGIDINWNNSTDTSVDYYTWERGLSVSNYSQIYRGDDLHYLDAGIVLGTVYYYRLTAHNTYGYTTSYPGIIRITANIGNVVRTY